MASAAASSPRGPRALPSLIAPALALVLTALCLAPGLRGTFVYDDRLLVQRNPLITDLARLPELFTSGLWGFLDPGTAEQIGYWRPLTSVALALGHRLGGGDPFAYHVLSLCVHLAATAAAWRLARRLTHNAGVAFATALFFGLHPVHVEAVAWISAINDPLYGLFALLAIDAWLAWRERGWPGQPGHAWKPALLALLAMLSKEQGVSVLAGVLALDLALRRGLDREHPLRSSLAPLARGYGMLCSALLAYYLARAAVFRDWGAGFDRIVTDFGVPAARLVVLRAEMLGGAIWLLVWPFDLQLFRPFVPAISLADPSLLRALGCIAAWAAAAAWLWRRRSGIALAALLFVPAMLAPLVLRISALGLFPLSERFLYLAVFGWSLALAYGALRWLPSRLAWTLVALVATAYGVRACTRTAFWRDEETIFRAEAAASPKSPYIRWGLGRVLLEDYRAGGKPEILKEAFEAFQSALDLLSAAQRGDQTIFATKDDHLQSNLGLAWSLLYEGELSGYRGDTTAYAAFEQIVESYPLNEQALTGLGVAALFLERYGEAEDALRKAIEINPRHVEAHHALGLARMRRGDWAGAASAFEEALRLRPDHLDDLLWLARALAQQGEADRAQALAERAAERHPQAPAPFILQATLAAQQKDIPRAAALVERALELDRNAGEAWLLKGKLHLARGENAAAETALVRATELIPLSFEAHYNVAAVLLGGSRRIEALPYLKRAYELRPADASGKALHDTLVALDIDDIGTLWELASVDAARGFDDDALGWTAKILARAPEHGGAHFLAGQIAKRRGDEEQALASWKCAVELMPESLPAHQALGELLVELGRKQEGLLHLERALDIAVSAAGSDPAAQNAIQTLRDAIERVGGRN